MFSTFPGGLARNCVIPGLMALSLSAFGHVPYLEQQDFTTTAPFVCPSPEQSIAVYAWLESSTDVDFYEVRVTTETLFHAGILVPVAERYADFRPGFALVGPGLPATTETLPVPLGASSGALVVHEESEGRREEFYEPFGGKSYYRGPTLDTPLEAGRYTLIYWDPQQGSGDYVAVVGGREIWKAGDMLRAAVVTPLIRRGAELHLGVGNGKSEKGGGPAVLDNTDGVVLYDFDREDTCENWQVTNDTVMGGVSSSRTGWSEEGGLIFAGEVSLENNGGFASVRGPLVQRDLSDFEGVTARVRGDGQKYRLTIRTDDRSNGVLHQVSFETVAGEWQVIRAPFDEFIPTYHGQRLSDDRRLRRENVGRFGFLIADKQAGPFRLEVEWIGVWR